MELHVKQVITPLTSESFKKKCNVIIETWHNLYFYDSELFLMGFYIKKNPRSSLIK